MHTGNHWAVSGVRGIKPTGTAVRARGGAGTGKPTGLAGAPLVPMVGHPWHTQDLPALGRGEPPAPSVSTLLAKGLADRDPALGTWRLPWHGRAREGWAPGMPHWWAEDAPESTSQRQRGPSCAPAP